MDVGADFTDEMLKTARRMAQEWYDNHKTRRPSVKPSACPSDEHSTSTTMSDTIEAFYAHRRLLKVSRPARSSSA